MIKPIYIYIQFCPKYINLKDREGYRIHVLYPRIIYDIIDEILQVEVIEQGHRKEIYDVNGWDICISKSSIYITRPCQL